MISNDTKRYEEHKNLFPSLDDLHVDWRIENEDSFQSLDDLDVDWRLEHDEFLQSIEDIIQTLESDSNGGNSNEE